MSNRKRITPPAPATVGRKPGVRRTRRLYVRGCAPARLGVAWSEFLVREGLLRYVDRSHEALELNPAYQWSVHDVRMVVQAVSKAGFPSGT